ncbi:hypothetical protein [Amycolatopsis magusensis]|uniref:hypothetical protein n=1 Tax=Amycolatopsis magusensis TaxID=882444 RepID=UPI003C2CE61C
MSDSAAPDDDFDPVINAPRASDASDDQWPDDEEEEQQQPPISRVRPLSQIRETPPLFEPPNPGLAPSTSTAVRPDSADDTNIRLGLWGAPRSGKTTYLSALRIAAQKPVMGYKWALSGCDDTSADFLDESVETFVVKRDFPSPTRGYRTLSWKFEGTKHREHRSKLGAFGNKLLGDHSHDINREFVVEMQDAAGEVFSKTASEQYYEDVQKHLMNADGIVYLFDPLLNKEAKTNSFDFFARTLSRLQRNMREQGRLAGSRLPHFVSVCVTKFDHPEIFQAAMKEGIIYQEHEDAMPVVPATIAPEFLRSLCHDAGSRWVCDQLQSEFLPDRVRYFAMSAVGFHLGHDRRFDLHDFSNIEPDGKHFRSTAIPVNVLEPIISLEQQVRRQAGLA